MGVITDFSTILGVSWGSTGVCILLLFTAAAFVAYCARPSRRGEARQKLYGGTLIEDFEVETPVDEPRLEIRCLEGANVEFRRIGVANLTSSGAVSWAFTFIGGDVDVRERVSPGFPNDRTMAGACCTADMTGQEWYHIHWIDEETGLWTAFTLHVRPGITTTAILRR